MNDFSVIGQRLRKVREKRGLTLAEVANSIDKSVSLVGSIERAERCPSLQSLIDLAEFYQLPLSYLFEDDLEQYQQKIGAELQLIMTEQGESIATLAKKTQINYFQLADFFQGRVTLSLEQLKSIAQILNLPVKKIVPQATRYISYIQHYLAVLGLDDLSIQNVTDYIYSKFEIQ